LVTVWFTVFLTKTKNRIINGIIYFILLPISVYSFYTALIDLEGVKYFYSFDGNWYYTPYDNTVSYYLFVLYLMVSVLLVYFVLIGWFFMAESNREKYQARILLVSLSFFFIFTFLSNLVLPFIHSRIIPAMAPINALILVGGALYVHHFVPTLPITPQTIYNLVINHVKEFLFIADRNGKIYLANQYTLSTLKYNAYDLIRSDLSDIFSEPERVGEIMKTMGSKNVSKQFRIELIGRDKQRFPVMLYVIKIEDQFNRVQAYVYSCIDYRQKLKLKEEIAERVRAEKNLSQIRKELELLVKKRTQELQEANLKLQQEVIERRSAEEQIKADLNEKIVLVQEVHHRVKNNIQMIISLVNMLCSHPKIDSDASEKLRDLAEKVRYISRIHEDFYSSPNLSNIAFSKYLKKSIGELYSNFGRRKDIVFKLNLADIKLDISQAIPLGIVFNELFVNSLVYAFEGETQSQEKSIISIEFYQNNGQYSLVVSDNGKGLPLPFKEIKNQKIGLQLVQVLTQEHLRGKLLHYGQRGTTFIIRFD
jgi:two-component sensor histidine kinase